MTEQMFLLTSLASTPLTIPCLLLIYRTVQYLTHLAGIISIRDCEWSRSFYRTNSFFQETSKYLCPVILLKTFCLL